MALASEESGPCHVSKGPYKQCWGDSSQSLASHKFGDSVKSITSDRAPVNSAVLRDSRTKPSKSRYNFM